MGGRARRAALLAAAVAALAAATAPPTAASPPPTPQPVTHLVPPPAPKPTSNEVSPGAPDPNPPRGGIGPLGEPVGGRRLLSRGVVAPQHVPRLPADLTAQGWVLFDVDTGAILAARDPHGRYQPASILKILTSVTLIPRLPGRMRVRVSPAAAHAECACAGLFPHGRYTVDQLFSGLLLVSGNDTAAALAEAAGGVHRTVALMNRTALDLGAYDTFAQTPSGLDGWQQLTSAYDMAIFLRAAVALPRYVAYSREATALLPAQHTDFGSLDEVSLHNQNELFLTTVPGALVAKTGYTDAAQHTFVGVIERHHRRLGVVFMRAQRWPLDQWQQASALADWGFSLPRDTPPVGHLDAPARQPQRPGSTATSQSASASQASASAAAHGGTANWAWTWLVAAGAAVAAGAGAAAWRLTRAR